MGPTVSKDSASSFIDWNRNLTKVCMIGIKGFHGRNLSWAPGRDTRANETHLKSEETWTLYIQKDTNLVVLGIGDGSANSFLKAREDGHTDAEGMISWHGGIFWRFIPNGDGSYSFKSMYDRYLTMEPPTHNRRNQVMANRTKLKDWEKFTITPVDKFDNFNFFISFDFNLN